MSDYILKYDAAKKRALVTGPGGRTTQIDGVTLAQAAKYLQKLEERAVTCRAVGTDPTIFHRNSTETA